MEKLLTNTMTIERKGIFDKNRKKRFELTFECKEAEREKSILVIGLNPASEDIRVLDTTTTFILNNLIPMGYTTITICNLYSDLFKQRLKPSEVPNNTENRKYLEEVLKRGFDAILLGYGNTFLTNKFVREEKENLVMILKGYKDKVVDIVDDKGEYARLSTIHPLMAGRYFPNRWKLRPFVFEEAKNKGERKEIQAKVKTKPKAEEREDVQNEESSPNQDIQEIDSVKIF